ncbi:MAG: carboxypeptidase-like regulatory domain-containing protein [Candidatus Electryonea clarkiae]|nr:carboxypeptidase-like regulatory domain-containing protein [Candidatus Electryonea clarkiae]
MSVSPNSQPPQNVNYDGFSENTINLWWDAPEPGYNVNEPDIWAFHNGNAYTNYWQYTDDIGEGVQYSDIELSGPFDINAVEFNLYQYYAGQPEARLDIWDISDWNNPEAIFTHSWFPNLGQYTTGWEYIEVGLTNLDHTNIAITVTTSGEGNNGGYRYMLRYDGDWENDYYMDIYMLGVGSGDEYLMNYGYEGNLLVNTYVTRHGDYISYPTGGGGGGNLEPGPNGFNPNNGGMTLDQMIESELAVQDDYGRWGPKHEKRYAAGMTAPGPTVDRICHPTPRMPERQGELDDFQDEILYYNVYHDDELVYSTTDAYEMMYTDDGAEEGTEYIYTITAVYDIDGNGAEGEGPPSDPVAAMAVMPPSSPEFIDYTHDDQNLTATLDWDIPLTNENGSDLDDLDGFNLYCNNELIQVLGSTDDTYTHNLTNPGWYWYVITAFDDVGNESESTDLGWEIIGSPDIASDFETNGDPLSGINFEWGEPASGPEEGFNGSTYLWATELSGQYEDATLYTLTMPSLFVENENAMATFEAWWDFENEFDGWIMLGSLDEGESWFRVDWWPEIGMTNYNTDFWGAEYDNPLVDYGLEWGDHFISGQSMGGEGMSWSYMGIRLADYVGQNIILMIAAGTDEANHLFDGLYIDDVELWNVSETVYGDIDGTVSASETGAAIEGANVTVQGIGVSTVTDQNGDYLFEDLPVQDWTVTVNVFGYNDEEAVVTLVGDAAVTQDFALLKPEIEVPELVSLDLPSGYEGEYNLPVNNPGDGLLTVGSLVIDGIEEGMLRIPGNNDGLGSSVQHGKATIVESISLKNPNIPKQKGPVAGNSNGSELDETIEEWMFSIYYEGVGMAWDDGSLLISSPDNGYIYEYDPYTGDNIDSYPVGYWGMPFDMQLVDDELWVLHLDMEGEMTRENGFIADDLMEDGVREVYVVNWYDYRNSYYSDVLYGSDFNWDNYTTLLWGFALQPDLSTMYLGSYPVSSMEEPVPDYIHPTGPISGMDFDPDIIDSWELDNVTSMTWYNDRLWAATVNTDNVEELDEPGQLYEIDSEGNILAVYDFPSSPMGAAGLTFDDEGALWYCDFSLTNIYRLELDLEPAYLYSITEYLEVEGNNNDVMTFGIDIPDWAAEGETFEATIQLATNTEDEVIEIPVYLNILGDVIERNLELDAGWNLVGLDILLDEDDVSLDSIFADEIDAGNLVLVKNGSGEFFDPELGINNIGDWATPEGYKVNVAEATTVSVWGAEISDQSAIDVGTGWNMVAYYPNTDIPADFALESIADDLVIAKAGDGTFYLPEYNYNGIGDMMPRAGYQLKMDADATLMYPDVGDWGELNAAPGQNAFTPASVDPEHFEIQTFGTITNMSILLDGSEIDEESLKEGDEIAFYDPRGNRVGVAVWNENDLVGVALWGDDPLTEVVEGFVEGENLFARLWLSEEDLEIPVEFISPSGDLKFSPDGLLIASVGGTRESVIPSEFFLAQNYPNPFNPTTTIKYGLRDAVNVQLDIYNILGQRVHTLVDGPQKAGYYTIVWNGKDLNSKLVSSGTYFYQVHAGEFVKVRKMVIIK